MQLHTHGQDVAQFTSAQAWRQKALKERKAIRDHLETLAVGTLQVFQIEITNRDGCPPASRQILASALQRTLPPPENPSPRARCTVVATRIEWTVTLAGTRGQRERQAKASQEENPEELGTEGGQEIGGATPERQTYPEKPPRAAIPLWRPQANNLLVPVAPCQSMP